MKKYNIVHIVGARPNFMKLAPVYEALKEYPTLAQTIVHTGQHYDYNMSDIFFEEFGMPMPHINLNVSGKSVLQQIGHGIIKLEEELPKLNPDLVIIYGDINATAYASIVCSKLGIDLAHVEAGLRSNDLEMPEETNRMIADALSNYFFTPSKDADENLLKEGKSKERIFFVGNVMIDTLVNFLPKADNASLSLDIPSQYGLVTLHRPSNVDDKNRLEGILATLESINENFPIIFPIHPRTRNNIDELFFKSSKIRFIEPQGYLSFLKLQKEASFVITDSGGIQEETTYLGIPCFTLRDNTERPVTIEVGTNILVGTNFRNLKDQIDSFIAGKVKQASIPALWDGQSAKRIAKIINELIQRSLQQ